MPTIRLDLTDDTEFIDCQYCKSHVEPYNNTSLSTTPIDNIYTKTLLKYHHLNCEKCGLYIEIHPQHSNEEGLIFLCSNSIPHKHCLCYECGLLYDLKTDKKKMDILKQLQYNNTTQTASAELGSQSAQSNNVLTSNPFSSMDIVSNSTLIVSQVLNEINGDNENVISSEPVGSGTGGTELFFGTIMALIVWIGIYMSSPELFRLSGCFVWLSIFYFLTNIYFTDNENVQRAVFGLFSFSPILGSIYLFQKTRRLNQLHDDIQCAIQFFCIFGCIVYLSYYWSPLAMYLFLINDFMKLSVIQQLISLFIAISIGSFILILLKNCNFLSTFPSKASLVDSDDHDIIKQHDLEIIDNKIAEIVPVEPSINLINNDKTTRRINKNKRKRRKKKKKRSN